MRFLLGFLPMVGCAVLMFACARMMRGSHKGGGSDGASADEVAELREEIARLKGERAVPSDEPVRTGE